MEIAEKWRGLISKYNPEYLKKNQEHNFYTLIEHLIQRTVSTSEAFAGIDLAEPLSLYLKGIIPVCIRHLERAMSDLEENMPSYLEVLGTFRSALKEIKEVNRQVESIKVAQATPKDAEADMQKIMGRIQREIIDAVNSCEKDLINYPEFRNFKLHHSTYAYSGAKYKGLYAAAEALFKDLELKKPLLEDKIEIIQRWLRNEAMALEEIVQTSNFNVGAKGAIDKASDIFLKLLDNLNNIENYLKDLSVARKEASPGAAAARAGSALAPEQIAEVIVTNSQPTTFASVLELLADHFKNNDIPSNLGKQVLSLLGLEEAGKSGDRKLYKVVLLAQHPKALTFTQLLQRPSRLDRDSWKLHLSAPGVMVDSPRVRPVDLILIVNSVFMLVIDIKIASLACDYQKVDQVQLASMLDSLTDIRDLSIQEILNRLEIILGEKLAFLERDNLPYMLILMRDIFIQLRDDYLKQVSEMKAIYDEVFLSGGSIGPAGTQSKGEGTEPSSTVDARRQDAVGRLRINLIEGLSKQDYPNSALLEILKTWVGSITAPLEPKLSFREEAVTIILKAFIIAANSMEKEDMVGDGYIEKAKKSINTFITDYLKKHPNVWLSDRKWRIEEAALTPFKYILADRNYFDNKRRDADWTAEKGWTPLRMKEMLYAISGVVRTALGIYVKMNLAAGKVFLTPEENGRVVKELEEIKRSVREDEQLKRSLENELCRGKFGINYQDLLRHNFTYADVIKIISWLEFEKDRLEKVGKDPHSPEHLVKAMNLFGEKIISLNDIIHGSSVQSAGSALQHKTDGDVGGISFRPQDMRIKYEPMGSLQGLNFKLPTLSYNDLKQMNLALEAKQIKQMIAGGMTPSGERIKEFLAACCQKQQLSDYQGEVAVWLVEACRLDEQQARDSSPELKEAIVILENIAA